MENEERERERVEGGVVKHHSLSGGGISFSEDSQAMHYHSSGKGTFLTG
jgi:hypothetical protein